MSRFLEAQPEAARAAITAALSSGAVEMAVLLHLDFADAPVRLSNRRLPFVDLKDGHEWRAGDGLLVSLPQLGAQADSLNPARTYALGLPYEVAARADWSVALTEAVADRANYATRAAALYGQLFDPATGGPLGWPFALDVARMDRMTCSFRRGGAVVSLAVESFMARQGVPVYGMQTYRDQKRRFPTDEGMQFTTEAGEVVTWTQW